MMLIVIAQHSSIVDEIVPELHNRIKVENNIIVYGLRETKTIEYEKRILEQLFVQLIKLKIERCVIEYFRLRQTHDEQPRATCTRLKNRIDVFRAFKNSKSLPNNTLVISDKTKCIAITILK